MSEQWRVACVRIPRFPIAAVWRVHRRSALGARRSAQLQLPLLQIESSRGRSDAPSRTSSIEARDTRSGDASGSPRATNLDDRISNLEWDDEPLALIEGKTLRAISGAAARAQVRSGMTVPEARARCAALELLPWDDAAIADAVTEVSAQLLAASPQVTPAAGEPGLWWVGAAGFHDADGERVLAGALSVLAGAWHPRARVAIADSCVAARAATWGSARGGMACIVPHGGDAAYLAPAPLALIPMDGELRATLFALGIGTAGAFAALEAEDVERRWGAEGLAAWRLARGEDVRRPVLATVHAKHAVDAELGAPTMTMEPILFLVRAALDRLCTALAAEGRAAAVVALTLTLDDARSALPSGAAPHTVTREVRLPHPVARAAQLFEHCHALLDRWPLTAPACGVTVTIVATAPSAAAQGDLMAAGWRDPAAADAAFARLRAELGPDSVVRPVARDEHRVERSGEWREERHSALVARHSAVAIEALQAQPSAEQRVPSAAFRVLELPDEVEVEREGARPCAVWWRGRRVAIAHASGPERLAGDWWKDEYRRDYWRCDSDAGELLLFVEDERWYVQGWFD